MENKNIKINNKSDKPDNIVLRDHKIIEKCISYENKLPAFMKDCFYPFSLFRRYPLLL